MVLLPGDEKEKHEVWFKAKMLSNNDCIANAKWWVSSNEDDTNERGVVDYIHIEDSVSNVGSKRSSQGSVTSGRSNTTSSARFKAERAALMDQAAALKARHALDEEEQQLKRKKEELELEIKLAASAARLAVLQASDLKSSS